MFCTSCGLGITSEGMFCTHCGASKTRSGPHENRMLERKDAQTASDAEGVMGAYTGMKTTGFMKMEPWVLVFTNQRLIVARISTAMQKEAAKATKGYFKKIGAMQGLYDSSLYMRMHPQDILSMNPENFVVPYGHITHIQFKRAVVRTDYEQGTTHTSQQKFTMTYDGQKLSMPMTAMHKDTEDAFIELMLQIFQGKFRFK